MNQPEKPLAQKLMQISNDVAAACGEIVKRTALSIKRRHFGVAQNDGAKLPGGKVLQSKTYDTLDLAQA